MWSKLRLAAVACAALLALNGIWWGWVEDWNPDHMAFTGVFSKGLLPFEPRDFTTPPFYTYVSFILAKVPVDVGRKLLQLVTGTAHDWSVAVLYCARLLHVGFFVGIVVAVHAVVRRASGQDAAVAAAFFVATSAGLVLQAHFLTTDVPVTFFMLLSFWLAQRIVAEPATRRYVLCGFAAGVATATKFNGLAAALAIPMFHAFAAPAVPWSRRFLDRRLVWAAAMVIVGFVVADPFAAIDFRKFAADFVYTYRTTPIYEGQSGSTSFARLAPTVLEIVGIPLGLATAAGLAAALVRLRRSPLLERATLVAALGVVALCFLVFGRSPRLAVRFVLPVAPLLLIAAAPAWRAALERRPRPAAALAALLTLYGALCSFVVGRRFAADPRMAAQAWVAEHVPAAGTIETTRYMPDWDRYPGVDVVHVRVPNVTGRRRLFEERFAADPAMRKAIERHEPQNDVSWFGAEALSRRNPDFIAVHSLYAGRFTDGRGGELYPGVRDYFRLLLEGELGYEVAFDETSRSAPAWLYPQSILFVDGRATILKRRTPGSD